MKVLLFAVTLCLATIQPLSPVHLMEKVDEGIISTVKCRKLKLYGVDRCIVPPISQEIRYIPTVSFNSESFVRDNGPSDLFVL